MAAEKDQSEKQTRKDASAVLHDNTISPRDNRKERGKALKAAYPHKIHAAWNPPAD